MDAKANKTTVERKSERELVVTRTINGPARLVWEAWTNPDLFKQWWVPKSAPIKLVSCEVDARVGGGYKLVFEVGTNKMAFFGKYLEVEHAKRLVWTNEEGGPDATSVTTVTFEEKGNTTIVVMSELHPSKAALDEHMGSGAASGTCESLDQLEDFIATRLRTT